MTEEDGKVLLSFPFVPFSKNETGLHLEILGLKDTLVHILQKNNMDVTQKEVIEIAFEIEKKINQFKEAGVN